MTYATVDDVATRLGRPISQEAEISQVSAWLEDVETVILARVPDLHERVDSGAIPITAVVSVEAGAVVRRVQNPTPGRTSRTESIDDGSVTDRWESSTDPWAITDGEWTLLLPRQTRGAFTIRPRYSGARW